LGVTLDAQDASVSAEARNGPGDAKVQLFSSPSFVHGKGGSRSIGPGTLVSGDSTVNGVAENKAVAAGDLTCSDSEVTGSADLVHVASGSLQSTDSLLVGTTKRSVFGSGALKCSDSTTDAFATAGDTGTLKASDCVVVGTTKITRKPIVAAVQAQESVVVGTTERTISTVEGEIRSQASKVTGVTERTVVAGKEGLALNDIDLDGIEGPHGNGAINNMIATSSGEFIATQGGASQLPQIFRSTDDGETWTTSRPTGISANSNTLAIVQSLAQVSNNAFVLVGGGNRSPQGTIVGARLFLTTDNFSTMSSIDLDTVLADVHKGNGNQESFGDTLKLVSVAVGGGKVVVTGNFGIVLVASTSDLTSWTLVDTPQWSPTIPLNASLAMYVAYGDDRFVISTQNFRTAYSSNGSTWTVGAEKTRASNPFGIAYGDDHFLIVGSDGAVCKTDNGTSVDVLVQEDALASVRLQCLDYNAEKNTWAVGGTGGSILIGKSGGTAWSYQNTSDPNQRDLKGIAFNGTNWVVSGTNGYLAYADASSFLPAVALYSGQSRVEIEYSISRNPIDATVEAQDAEVIGVAFRKFEDAVVLKCSDSIVVGAVEREINGSGTLVCSDSTVTGSATAKISGSGVLVCSDSKVTTVIERTIHGTGQLQCSDAEVHGETTGLRSTDVELIASDCQVVGVAERIIEDGGVTHALVSGDSIVVGSSSVVRETTSADLVASNSTVVGVAARQPTVSSIELQCYDSQVVGATKRSVFGSGALQSGESSVSADGADRGQDATGALVSGDSTVVGATSRTIHLVTGIGSGISLSYKRPQFGDTDISNDAKILYPYEIQLFAVGYTDEAETFVGEYLRQPLYYTIDTTDNSVSVDTTSTYIVFTSRISYLLLGGYKSIIYDTNNDEWVGIITLKVPQNWETTFDYGGAPEGLRTPWFTYSGTPPKITGYTQDHTETGETTSSALIEGDGERLLNNDGLGQAVYSGDSKVVATYEISRKPIVATLESGPSTVTALSEVEKGAGNPALKAQDATVVGLGERLLNNAPVGQQLQSGDSTIVGLANIGRVTNDIALKAQDATVVGVADVVHYTVGTQRLTTTDCLVTGVAERTVNGTDTLVSGDSQVTGEGIRGVDDNVATHALEVGDSTVVGVAEREHRTAVQLKAGDSTVNASEIYRRIIASGALKAGDATVNADVDQEFEIRIALKAQDAHVNATVSRSYPGIDVELQADNFVIHASNVDYSDDFIQVKRTVSAALKSGAASVTATTELSSNLLESTDLQASDAIVVGVAERVMRTAVDIRMTPFNVEAFGIAERQIDGDDAAVQSGDATIVGVAERTIWHYGLGQQLGNGVALVTGRAERVITVQSADLVTGDSQVVGAGDRGVDDEGRTHRLVSGDAAVVGRGFIGYESQTITLKSGDATVTAVVEITSNSLSSSNLKASDAVVFGNGDRVVDGDPGLTLESGPSQVTGLGIRGSNSTGELASSPSTVVGVAERASVGSGDIVSGDSSVEGQGARGGNILSSAGVKAQDAQVTGLAERTVVRVPDEVESALSPSNTNSKVSYTGSKLVLSGFTTTNAKFNGTYELLPEHGFVVDSQSDGDYTLAVDNDYNFYHRKVSASLWYIVVYSEATSGNGHFANHWYVTETGYDPKTLYNAVNSGYGILGDAQTEEVEIETVSMYRDRLTGGFNPVKAQDATVSATVEIGSNLLSSANLKAGNAHVTAVVERTINSISAALKTSDSKVNGIAIGIEDLYETIQSGDSKVVGLAKRIVEDNGVTHALQSGPSTVTGEVSRTIHNVGDVKLVASDVLVVGVGDRVIDDAGATHALVSGNSTVTGTADIIKTLAEPIILKASDSTVNGVGTRIVEINDLPVNIKASDSIVVGVAERLITEDPDDQSFALVASDSIVTGVAERLITEDPDEQSFALVASDSIVRGVAERKLNNHGLGQQLTTTDSIVFGEGIVERKIRADLVTTDSLVVGVGKVSRLPIDATLECTDSIVTAVTEITSNLLSSANLQASDAVIVCNAERVIDQQEQTAALRASESVVVGVAERALNNDGLGQSIESGESTVVGVAERTINGTGDIIASDSIIVGRAERVIEEHPDQQSFNIKSTDCRTTSVTQLIRKASGALKCSDSRTRGFAFGIEDIYEELVTTDSIVVGSGFRTSKDHTSEHNLVASDAIVRGRAERSIDTNDINQDLVVDGNAVVTGIAERIIRKPGFGTDKQRLVSGNSTVTGLGERTVKEFPEDFANALTVTDSLVTGLAERTVEDNLANHALKPTENNIVVGVAERIIEQNELNAAFRPNIEHIVTGVAERIVEDGGTTHALTVTDSIVSGVAERIIPAEDIALRPTEFNIVVGVAERIINNDGLGQVLTVTDSIVTGLAERIIEEHPDDQGDDPVSGDSKVTGLAERIIEEHPDDFINALVLTDSIVTGLAERSITLLPGFNHIVSDDSKVVGLAERTVEDNGTIHELTVSDSIVTGVAERTIVGAGVLVASDSQVVCDAEREIRTSAALRPTEYHIVTGVAERLLNNDGLGQAVQSGDSRVVGLGERTLNNDGLGQSVESGPSTVTAVVKRTVKDGGRTHPLVASDCIVEGIAERIITGAGVLVASDSIVVGDMDRVSDDQGGANLRPTEYHIVTGVAERIVTEEPDEVITALTTTDSLVEGNGKISRLPIEAALKCSDSQVFGTSENIIVPLQRPIRLKSGPSHVTAVVERTSNDIDASPKAQDAHVTAVVERTSNALDASPQAQPSTVVGVAKRTVEDNGATHALQAQPSTVVGVAERILNNDGLGQAVQSGDSRVVGNAEREIDVDAALQCSDSKVECTIYQTLGEQQDIPPSSTLRIMEEEVRTILVRTAA
jgi:hypothetical protein